MADEIVIVEVYVSNRTLASDLQTAINGYTKAGLTYLGREHIENFPNSETHRYLLTFSRSQPRSTADC